MKITNNVLTQGKFFWIYPMLIWLAFFPTSVFFILFFNLFSHWIEPIVIICFLPISLVVYYSIFILLLLLFAKLILILINLIHHPKEGIFRINLHDKDFLFFLLRRRIKWFTLKIYNYYPLPWAKILALKIFNLKIHYNTGILDSFIDSDFVEIGNSALLGEGSIVMSSLVIGDLLLVKKVILHDGCTIGAFSVISPGTIVEEGAILGMGSYTNINQRIEKNSIYYGRPAKSWKKSDNNFI